MTAYSFSMVEIQVINNATQVPMHVANFSQGGRDLLQVIEEFLRKVASEGGHATRDRYFTPATIQPQPAPSRRLRATVDYGRYGTRRPIRSVATGKSRGVVTPQQVAGDQLRGLFAVPKNGVYALMACEHVGQSSYVGLLSSELRRYVRDLQIGCRVELRKLDEYDAWEDYLKFAELKAVEFEYVKAADNNRASAPTVVHHGVQAIQGRTLPKPWIGGLRGKSLKPGDIISLPVEEEGEPDEIRLTVQRDGKRKTIRLNNALPNFTWSLGGDRPSDGDFYGEAETVLGQRLTAIAADPAES